MRINMSLDKYDIKSLDEVYKTSEEMKKKSELLEELGHFILSRLNASSDEFTSNNYNKIREATEDYLKKMQFMRDELTELSKSCHEFAEKIADIWS